MINSEDLLIDGVNTINDYYDSNHLTTALDSRFYDLTATRQVAPSSIYLNDNEYGIRFNSGGNEYEKLEFNPAKIQSSVYEYEVFAMLETMKQIITDSLGVSRELFDNTYNENKEKIQQKYEDIITANNVTNKLLK